MEMENKKKMERRINQSITYESDVLVKMENTSLYKLLKTNDEKLVEQFNKVEELKKSSERMTTEDDNKISEYFSRMQEIKRLIGINVFKISIVCELVDLYKELRTAQNVQDAMTVLKKIEFKFLEQKIALRFKMSLAETDSNDKTSKFKLDDDFAKITKQILSKTRCLRLRESLVSYKNLIKKMYGEDMSGNIDLTVWQFENFTYELLKSGQRAILLSSTFIEYVKFGYNINVLKAWLLCFGKVANSRSMLMLLSNPERYNFFLQFHHILEENLPAEDKRLFYNYLTSCREKLQDEKDRYHLLYPREWILIGVFIFGIIASTAVLTINLLEIYAATWFFWFGIVGVVLTILVGIYLGLCIKENWNNLRKLESDLLKNEDKTIQQKINEIDCAMEVYDLDKIRNFEEPEKESEQKKISTIDLDKKENTTILNNHEINTNKQNDNPKLGPIDQEETIDNN